MYLYALSNASIRMRWHPLHGTISLGGRRPQRREVYCAWPWRLWGPIFQHRLKSNASQCRHAPYKCQCFVYFVHTKFAGFWYPVYFEVWRYFIPTAVSLRLISIAAWPGGKWLVWNKKLLNHHRCISMFRDSMPLLLCHHAPELGLYVAIAIGDLTARFYEASRPT